MNKYDRPNVKQSLDRICVYLGSTTDTKAWDNIITFLEGMQTASCDVRPAFLESLTRRAGEVKQWDTILRAAAMGKRTGLRLSHREVTKALLVDIHRRSVASSYKATEPEKTLNQIVLLLEDKMHCGNFSQREAETRHKDMRCDPLLLALLLEQASAASIIRYGGKDHDGKVAKAIARLLAMADTLPGGVIGYLEKVNRGRPQTFVLEELALVSNALTLADKVDLSRNTGKEQSPDMSMNLQSQLKKVNARIEVLKPQVAAEPSRSRTRTRPRRSQEILDGIAKVQKELKQYQ